VHITLYKVNAVPVVTLFLSFYALNLFKSPVSVTNKPFNMLHMTFEKKTHLSETYSSAQLVLSVSVNTIRNSHGANYKLWIKILEDPMAL
jgi:hypothetical protein